MSRLRLRRMHCSLPPPPPLSSLHGTVQNHNAFILLHTPNQPPPTFPARGPVSQVQQRLQLSAAKWGGIINWVWHAPSASSATGRTSSSDSTMMTTCSEELLDKNTTEASHSPESLPSPPEVYTGATVFSKNGRLDVPQVNLDNVDEVGETIRRFAVEDTVLPALPPSPAGSRSPSPSQPEVGVEPAPGDDGSDRQEPEPEVHVFICTHMARDCRCGVLGGEFSRVLREQVSQLGFVLGEKKVRLRLGEVAHVGGHQYAPNVLIYPYGDWYGVLTPLQVPSLLEELGAAVETHGVRPLGKTEEPLLRSLRDHWRGRMGMSKEEQAGLATTLGLGKHDTTSTGEKE